MWGRGCHGAHGAGDATGPMVVLVGWVPSLHPGQGLGGLVPRAVVPLGEPQNRRVWQEWAKPCLGSVGAGGEQQVLRSQPRGWEC